MTDTRTRKCRVHLPHFTIDFLPGALVTASSSYADRNLWLLVGTADELALFEGVEAYFGISPIDPDGFGGGLPRVLVVCDPDSPVGPVMMEFATNIAREAQREADYMKRNDPDEADFQPMCFDWTWPVRKAIQRGGKFKEMSSAPAAQEQT